MQTHISSVQPSPSCRSSMTSAFAAGRCTLSSRLRCSFVPHALCRPPSRLPRFHRFVVRIAAGRPLCASDQAQCSCSRCELLASRSLEPANRCNLNVRGCSMAAIGVCSGASCVDHCHRTYRVSIWILCLYAAGRVDRPSRAFGRRGIRTCRLSRQHAWRDRLNCWRCGFGGGGVHFSVGMPRSDAATVGQSK